MIKDVFVFRSEVYSGSYRLLYTIYDLIKKEELEQICVMVMQLLGTGQPLPN